MLSLRTFILSGLLLASSAVTAQRLYYVPRGPKSIEVGLSYASASADFKYVAQSYNEFTGRLIDTSFTQHAVSKFGYGGSVGYYWPIIRLGGRSRLTLNATFMYNAYIWDNDALNYSATYSNIVVANQPDLVTGATIEEALPIGIDYKYGCDAIMNKGEKLCASFGAGIFPSMDATIYHGTNDLKFHARPYLKAEAGLFAGICMKLRLTYIMGNVAYFDYGKDDPGNVEHGTFKSTGTAVLSLILMPMSWKFGSYL
jgi:hypothetical protein